DVTLYPSEYYSARFARIAIGGCASPPCWDREVSRTRHVYVEGQRVAVDALVVSESQQSRPEAGIQFGAPVREFLHGDLVGSVASLSGESGTRTQQVAYLPFGEPLFDHRGTGTDPLPQSYEFNGMELDQETGLQYFGARYYDGHIGRWISPDPL